MQTKYSFVVFCVLLFALINAYSQSALDSTPANRNWNLVNTIYNNVSVTGPYYYGKKNANPAYNQVTYSGETDTLQILNSLLKASIFIWLLYKLFPFFFGVLKKESQARINNGVPMKASASV